MMSALVKQDDPEQVIGQHGQTDCQKDKWQKDCDDPEPVKEFNESFKDT